jgi:hypothetical protein
MAQFFNYFPKTFYSSNNSSSMDVVTNIITRFNFEENLKKNSSAFYEYELKEGDTPDIIARKFYGNSERHWMILLFNDIIDPQYDWPLNYSTFNDFVDKKYSTPEYANSDVKYQGIEWAKINTKAYYKIITRTSSDSSIAEKLELNLDAYSATGESSVNYLLADGTTITETVTKETKSYYEYEEDLNESKRSIKLLKPEFVSAVESEFKRVIR